MKQPELPDIGDKIDVANHRLRVATEIFPRNLGRKIVKAEEICNESDYDTFYIASKEVTIEQIQTVEQLIELVEVYCKNKQEA